MAPHLMAVMLLTILLVVQILISIALVGVVLLQKSEGGALGMGGGPSGIMTARGAGNLLTTLTWWLGGAFFACAVALTIFGNMANANRSTIDADEVGVLEPVEEGAAPAEAPVEPPLPTPSQPTAPSLDDIPLAGSTPAPAETPAP